MNDGRVLNMIKGIGKWLKSKRQVLLISAFALLWVSFPLSYIGGISGNDGVMAAAFTVAGISCLLCILLRKQ